MINQCPSLASMLKNGQQVTHHAHSRGWIETPDGQFYQPKASEVQFIKGRHLPFVSKLKPRRRWFARLMGIFA